MGDQAMMIAPLVRIIKSVVAEPRKVMIHWITEESTVVVKCGSQGDVTLILRLISNLAELGIGVDYDLKPRPEFEGLPTINITFERK
jgi:hypothetical protein